MFRLVALSSFLIASAAAGGAVSSSSSAAALRDLMQSSPQDALASVQSAIRSADNSFLKDRNLISQTCADEMAVALQSTSSLVLSDIPEETVNSACTVDATMTDIQCDASKIPDANALVAATCDSNGHVYAEVTYVLSMTNGTETIRYEVNNMGICVGSSCTEDEVSEYLDSYSQFIDGLAGEGSGTSVSYTLEGFGSSSSSRIMWSSSIFAGAVAVGLMLFWA